MMRHNYYILNEDHVAIPVDVMTWAEWYEANTQIASWRGTRSRRRGCLNRLPRHRPCLHADHEPRQIFETLVFGGKHDQEMDRYATWAQAEAGHAWMVRRVSGGVSARSP